MKLRIQRLWCTPILFDPITFSSGVNLILGERSEVGKQGRKENGVGKSLCVDFLHFALLRDFDKTRVSRIPVEIFPDDFTVSLDLIIGDDQVRIDRKVALPTQPSITVNGQTTVFAKLDEAVMRLSQLLFQDHPLDGTVSARKVLSLLMRDEASGFQDITNPHSASKLIPPDLEPHLFLMGIDVSALAILDSTIQDLERVKRRVADLKKWLTDNGNRSIEEVPLRINAERETAHRIEEAMKSLRADPAFESVESDLVEIESRLSDLRAQRKALAFQIQQINSIPLPEQITVNDLEIVYEKIREGLGELVQKSFDQAKAFKARVEEFQRGLQQDEKLRLEKQRKELNRQISDLSRRHADIASQLDGEGALRELEVGLDAAAKRAEDYYRLKSQYDSYTEALAESEEAKAARIRDLNSLRRLIGESKVTAESLEKTAISLHERIQGSSAASLRFEISDSMKAKRPLTLQFRAQDDGSKSVNMAKVFIYDFALMLNERTRQYHPGFLVHDNILEMDQDTTEQCLNFIASLHESAEAEFQYILTINRDKIDDTGIQERLDLVIEAVKRASFTKSTQFLKVRYQEKSK